MSNQSAKASQCDCALDMRNAITPLQPVSKVEFQQTDQELEYRQPVNPILEIHLNKKLKNIVNMETTPPMNLPTESAPSIKSQKHSNSITQQTPPQTFTPPTAFILNNKPPKSLPPHPSP